MGKVNRFRNFSSVAGVACLTMASSLMMSSSALAVILIDDFSQNANFSLTSDGAENTQTGLTNDVGDFTRTVRLGLTDSLDPTRPTPASGSIGLNTGSGGSLSYDLDDSTTGNQVNDGSGRLGLLTLTYDDLGGSNGVNLLNRPLLTFDIGNDDEGVSPPAQITLPGPPFVINIAPAAPSLRFVFTLSNPNFGSLQLTTREDIDQEDLNFNNELGDVPSDLCGGDCVANNQVFDLRDPALYPDSSGDINAFLQNITQLTIEVEGSASNISINSIQAVPWDLKSGLLAAMQGIWVVGLGALWYRKRRKAALSSPIS